MKFERLSRYYYLRFTRLKGNPNSLAMGTAIGVFIGISPTIPLHTVLILGITIATRTSTIAGIISSWLVCNPLTYIPIYYFSMLLGNLVTPYELNWQRIKNLIETLTSHQSFSHSLKEILSLGYEAIIVMVIGGIVLALPFTIASYYSSLHLFLKIQ
jgi:uncharacterized protein (DUF2062 family)